jgi:hypothetical protein
MRFVSETREALRRRAWSEAGIDAEVAARLAREHGWLAPAGQPAAEVLDLDERARLMRGIASFYGRLHASARDRLLWAGFAAIAVNDGVRPVTELAQAAAGLAQRAGRLSSRLGRWLQPIAQIAEDGIKCAYQTNYAIFEDLAWAHLAFLDGGIEAIQRFAGDGELHADIARGFQEIAAGARRGSESLILQGNLRLFHHEQRLSVTPVFERYREAMAFLSRTGLITVPNRALAERATSLGLDPAWQSEESYGPFASRWRWLVRHAGSRWSRSIAIAASAAPVCSRRRWRAPSKGVPRAPACPGSRVSSRRSPLDTFPLRTRGSSRVVYK